MGASLEETIDVHCRFRASPPLTSVRWEFGTGSEAVAIPSSRYSVEERQSTLSYTVASPGEFGDLHCWGTNELGEQKDPCIYRVIEASLPEKPSNCSAVNRTSSSIIVKCIEGHNGGLEQMFHAKVFDMSKHKVVLNATFKEPLYVLDKLPHSTDFLLTIYSSNGKGPSEKYIMQVYTDVPTESELLGKNYEPYINHIILQLIESELILLFQFINNLI